MCLFFLQLFNSFEILLRDSQVIFRERERASKSCSPFFGFVCKEEKLELFSNLSRFYVEELGKIETSKQEAFPVATVAARDISFFFSVFTCLFFQFAPNEVLRCG